MTTHERDSQFTKIEKLIFSDRKYFFTAVSYLAVIIISVNLIFANSLAIGTIASLTFFVINGTFLAHSFFEKKKHFLRWLLGSFLLVMFLGLVGWFIMIIHNLDIPRSSITLLVVATLCSFANRLTKKRANHGLKSKVSSLSQTKATSIESVHMNNQATPKSWMHYSSRLIFLFLEGLLTYMLIMSRTSEVYTVWEVMHPAFIPTFFVATFLLIVITFSSDRIEYKLSFVIIHSILLHSFFSIVFPAGDLSGQQMILGRTRRVFDNTILHGLSGWPTQTPQIFLVEMFDGINFQAALSVVFARMFSIDIFYVHLSLVPVLWGVFITIASYLTIETIGGDEKTSVLSGLLVSAFPYTTYFGAISVPNSLGFIFFFFSLYFMLKHLTSNDSKTAYWMMTFSLFSFLSHYLTGIMSFSLLLLAVSFKAYESEKKSLSVTPKVSLVISFFAGASLLPLSFIYLRFFGTTHAIFTLDKFSQLPLQENIGLFLLGELIYGFDLETILLVVVGPALALLYMIYLLYKLKRDPTAKYRTHIYFLFAAFLMILVDYRILKLFMDGLPLNEERLWVFRDFIAAPFVALAIYAVFSSLKTFLKATSLQTVAIATLKALSKRSILRVLSLLFTLNVLIPVILGGWITFSLHAAYPQVAPLQTTWYELEAVKYIEENTHEKYVVICDIWTIFAGEVIVGINNPRAYYFGEYDKTGYDLFVNMTENPSPQWMLLAMNYTDTTVAYFIITEEEENPFHTRLLPEEYNRIIQQAQQNKLQTYPEGIFYYKGEEKLRIFYYRKSTD